MEKIKSVSEFINIISKKTSSGCRFVYRGEHEEYDTFCTPNIFRNKYFNHTNFERNIIEKMKASGFDHDKNSYLLTAIEAQHGGFPSRLLDISYNALIALHFAVTPFYNKDIKDKDSKDGVVYIIKVEDMYIPSSKKIQDFYEYELLNTNSIYNKLTIFKNHFKMLDFYSKNPRIIAQQGGFILFCGNDSKSLPDYLVQKVYISKDHKKIIRKELLNFFNISNAFVYPESNNSAEPFVNEVSNYSQSKEISFENEITEIRCRITKQYEFYKQQIFELLRKENSIDKTDKKEEAKLAKAIKDNITKIEVHFHKCFEELDESILEMNSVSEKKTDKSDNGLLEEFLGKIEDLYRNESEYLNKILKNHSISTYDNLRRLSK